MVQKSRDLREEDLAQGHCNSTPLVAFEARDNLVMRVALHIE
jgi:hypothetical protein